MSVNVKMGVDLGGFTAGIREGQNVLKGLNAEMKATEAEFKATGNAEQMLANKTKTLTSQLNVQKGIADAAQAALQKMAAAGVDPASAAYQKMYVQLMNAQAGMNEAQAALNALDGEQQAAAQNANELADGMASIGKKISLDQVITGIGKITDGLENAARKAARIGEQLWDSIMESARWADDTATMAQMYGIDIDTFQRMQKLVTNGLDTSVDSMLGGMDKLKKGIGKDSKEVNSILQELGVTTKKWADAGESGPSLITRDEMEVFWEAGQAIMNMGDAFDKEAAAQTLFGKGWKELVPLFKEYKTVDEYRAALEKLHVVDDKAVEDGAALNDKISELKGNLKTLEDDVLLSMAPALTGAADALNGLLTSVLEYLEKPEGQQMLESLGTAVSGLFKDLSDIDPQEVVKGFTDVFNTVIDSVKWVVDHSGEVIGALEAIVTGWGVLKLTGGALEIVNLINGISGLNGGVAAAAGKAAGAAWGSGFASAVAAAAPWLIGLYTLLNPAGTAKNDQDMLYDPETHKLTKAGEEAGITMEYDEFMNWKQLMNPKFSAEGQADWVWENQVKNGNAWVEMTEDQINAVQKFYDVFRENGMDFTDADWDAYEGAFEGAEEVFNRIDELFDHFTQTHEGQLPEDLPEDFFKIAAEPVVADGAAESIAEQVGQVEIPVSLVLSGSNPLGPRINLADLLGHHANGLSYVPYDGYLAALHKGEMVVPAREISSRNYSSNLYVESMIMNNGTDAQGLAAAMVAAQRRTMAGYGS